MNVAPRCAWKGLCMNNVDAIIIGSGQGGMPLAKKLAEDGKQVVLFERGRVGGSCVNYGCTPSKAFLAAAHAAGRARASQELGVYCDVRVDFGRVMQRVRKIRDSFTESSEETFKDSPVQLVRAEASFTPDGHVQADGQRYAAPLVIIDTGSRAMIPPVEGLEGTPYLTDKNVWQLDELPERLLVLGGGYVGLELGQAFARLGSEVRIADSNARVLHKESARVSAVLQEALERDGVQFHLGAKAERVAYEGGNFRLQLAGGETLEGDTLLVATGRKPNTEVLNAPEAGIVLTDKGFIKVNERLESTRKGVYAIGEAAGQPAFTHVSWEDHRRLLAILDGQDRTKDDRALVYAVFTEPQVGRVGMSRAQAEEAGHQVRTATLDVSEMARAIEWGHDLGFYEVVVDDANGSILGATLVGYEASEIVQIFIDLISRKATWQALNQAMHIHPTYAENLPSLVRQLKK